VFADHWLSKIGTTLKQRKLFCFVHELVEAIGVLLFLSGGKATSCYEFRRQSIGLETRQVRGAWKVWFVLAHQKTHGPNTEQQIRASVSGWAALPFRPAWLPSRCLNSFAPLRVTKLVKTRRLDLPLRLNQQRRDIHG